MRLSWSKGHDDSQLLAVTVTWKAFWLENSGKKNDILRWLNLTWQTQLKWLKALWASFGCLWKMYIQHCSQSCAFPTSYEHDVALSSLGYMKATVCQCSNPRGFCSLHTSVCNNCLTLKSLHFSIGYSITVR